MGDYRDVNRANWDDRVAAHAASPDYAVARFTEDSSFLSDVVTFDVPRLGDIDGLAWAGWDDTGPPRTPRDVPLPDDLPEAERR